MPLSSLHFSARFQVVTREQHLSCDDLVADLYLVISATCVVRRLHATLLVVINSLLCTGGKSVQRSQGHNWHLNIPVPTGCMIVSCIGLTVCWIYVHCG
jgi:hypothetical protein